MACWQNQPTPPQSSPEIKGVGQLKVLILQYLDKRGYAAEIWIHLEQIYLLVEESHFKAKDCHIHLRGGEKPIVVGGFEDRENEFRHTLHKFIKSDDPFLKLECSLDEERIIIKDWVDIAKGR